MVWRTEYCSGELAGSSEAGCDPGPDGGGHEQQGRDARVVAQRLVAEQLDQRAGRQTAHCAAGDHDEVGAVLNLHPLVFASYRITEDSAVLAQAEASPSAPRLTITSPSSARSFAASTVEVSWTGADPDGDNLTYLVQYSNNGGDSYDTVANGVTATSVQIDRGHLAGSTQARIRVIASDGVRSTTAQSLVFSVAPHAPSVFIHSPHSATTIGGFATVALDASAFDNEDGSLAGSAITWSSSIDGTLASSGFAVITTDQLTAGTHILTATATDSDNMTGSATVTIVVKDTNDAPVASDDSAHTRTGRSTAINVVANDTDTEDDLNPHSVRVLVPAALGIAAAGRAGTLTYRPAAAGYDPVVYEVCDRRRQCARAEATVIIMET